MWHKFHRHKWGKTATKGAIGVGRRVLPYALSYNVLKWAFFDNAGCHNQNAIRYNKRTEC